MSMVKDTLTGKMDYTPIPSVKVLVEKIKDAAHKNGDLDDTCERSLNHYISLICGIYCRNVYHSFSNRHVHTCPIIAFYEKI